MGSNSFSIGNNEFFHEISGACIPGRLEAKKPTLIRRGGPGNPETPEVWGLGGFPNEIWSNRRNKIFFHPLKLTANAPENGYNPLEVWRFRTWKPIIFRGEKCVCVF